MTGESTTKKRMAKTNTKPKASTEQSATSATARAANTASAGETPVEQRENPRINEKIDEWIKQFPDKWNYFMSLPPERMARKLVLNEIDRYERMQKAKSYRQSEQDGGETAPRYDRSQGNGMRTR
jgi:hypothetical protein